MANVMFIGPAGPRGRGRHRRGQAASLRESLESLAGLPRALKLVWETHRGLTVLLAAILPALVFAAGVALAGLVLGTVSRGAEYEVFRRFRELAADKTAILISHRFSRVRMADRILVIEGGRIVEEGTHAQLLASGGRYAALFNLQAEGYR